MDGFEGRADGITRRLLCTALALVATGPVSAGTPKQAGNGCVANARMGDPEIDGSLRQVIGRVARRLASPACQQVLSDFTDPAGRLLRSRLDELGLTPEAYLNWLFFYDGSSSSRCSRPGVAAFTFPGSRVIFVCPRQFHFESRRDPFWTEALIIHEVLHSLGLGENPPSSREITARVVSRCLKRSVSKD